MRAFRPEDEQRVLALLQATFGRWPPGQIENVSPQEFCRWKHMSCPFGRSVLFVGEPGDVRAGSRVAIWS